MIYVLLGPWDLKSTYPTLTLRVPFGGPRASKGTWYELSQCELAFIWLGGICKIRVSRAAPRLVCWTFDSGKLSRFQDYNAYDAICQRCLGHFPLNHGTLLHIVSVSRLWPQVIPHGVWCGPKILDPAQCRMIDWLQPHIFMVQIMVPLARLLLAMVWCRRMQS